ncbi:MAG: T9SS type A sorting domain-containing protein [Bacteroidales bacterium]|nr:T9SS type A sorting domain-containing protein [Candidatus Latescibacterota bacterium]
MKRTNSIFIGIIFVGLVTAISAPAEAGERTSPLIIDHTCTDISKIPLEVIDAVQDNCRFHYARQSHGRQLHTGLARLEESDFTYSVAWPYSGGYLVEEAGAWCMYTTPADPTDYWSGAGLDRTRATLDGTPALNISGFCWCTHLDTGSESMVNDYLATMNMLEQEYPNVTFVYFTGTAEHAEYYGYNRHNRNEQIRQFCIENNKVLYDYADIDCWWKDPATGEWEFSTYEYNGQTVPVEHPQLAGADENHTSFENCDLKGNAAWWLMAKINGWEGTLDIAVTSVTCTYKDGVVLLDWDISADETVIGYNIYRSDDGGEHFFRLNSILIPATERTSYPDLTTEPDRVYYYRVGAVGTDREFTSLEIRVTTVDKSVLQIRNYPNPCNPSTTIEYSVAVPGSTLLAIYDTAGRRVATLVDGQVDRGEHRVVWDGTNERGSNVCSGIYYYRLTSGKQSMTKKLLVMR